MSLYKDNIITVGLDVEQIPSTSLCPLVQKGEHMDDLLYSPCTGVFASSIKFIKPWGFQWREKLTGLCKTWENLSKLTKFLKDIYICPSKQHANMQFKNLAKYWIWFILGPYISHIFFVFFLQFLNKLKKNNKKKTKIHIHSFSGCVQRLWSNWESFIIIEVQASHLWSALFPISVIFSISLAYVSVFSQAALLYVCPN